jgi:excisionase family DNA binding protein
MTAHNKTNTTAEATAYLTTTEAVTYSHSSVKTLRRAELAGELQAYKPGKQKLYKLTDLDNWVASKTVDTPHQSWPRPKLSELLAATS